MDVDLEIEEVCFDKHVENLFYNCFNQPIDTFILCDTSNIPSEISRIIDDGVRSRLLTWRGPVSQMAIMSENRWRKLPIEFEY